RRRRAAPTLRGRSVPGRAGRAHLLAAGPAVLDGRGADEAGDAAQALEPRPVALHGHAHQVVARLAGRRGQLDRAGHLARRDAAQGNPRDERLDTLVGDDEIRAAAEDAEGEPAPPRPCERVEESGLVVTLDEVARWPADAQRAVGRELDVLSGCERRQP